MGTVASVLQGVLFGGLNTAIVAYIGDELKDRLGITLGLLPRLSVFVFCMSFVLGLVVIESTTLRLDPDHGPIIGPIGTFLAAWVTIIVASSLTLLTNEYALLTPIAFSVAYAYGHAKAINHSDTTVGPFLASIAILFGLVALLVESDYVDEFANTMGSYFDMDRSNVPVSYMVQKGGVFALQGFAPLFVTVASFGLMRTQLMRA